MFYSLGQAYSNRFLQLPGNTSISSGVMNSGSRLISLTSMRSCENCLESPSAQLWLSELEYTLSGGYAELQIMPGNVSQAPFYSAFSRLSEEHSSA